MPPPRNREHDVLLAVSAACLLGLAWLAWSAIGWFGVGLLGLLMLFIAVRIEMEGNRPIGPQMTPDLYAGQYRSEAQHSRAERAARLSELGTVTSAARLAAIFGAALAVAGFGVFFLL